MSWCCRFLCIIFINLYKQKKKNLHSIQVKGRDTKKKSQHQVLSVKFSAGVAVPVFAFGGRTVVQNGSFLTSAFQHLLKQNLVQGCQNKRKVLVNSRLDDLIVPEHPTKWKWNKCGICQAKWLLKSSRIVAIHHVSVRWNVRREKQIKTRTLKDLLDSFHNLERSGQLAGAGPSGSDRIDGRLGGAFRQPVERVVNQAQAFHISDVLGSALWTRKFD